MTERQWKLTGRHCGEAGRRLEIFEIWLPFVIGAALKATATRDANFKALKAWTSEFRKIVKRTLRERPDLLGKLEL